MPSPIGRADASSASLTHFLPEDSYYSCLISHFPPLDLSPNKPRSVLLASCDPLPNFGPNPSYE